MPRKRKTANEMNDQELMERAFGKRVLKRVNEEIGLTEDENDADTATTPRTEESSG